MIHDCMNVHREDASSEPTVLSPDEGEDVIQMTSISDQPRQPEPIDRRRLITSTIWTLLILAVGAIAPVPAIMRLLRRFLPL
jgi:hypothetical protein